MVYVFSILWQQSLTVSNPPSCRVLELRALQKARESHTYNGGAHRHTGDANRT